MSFKVVFFPTFCAVFLLLSAQNSLAAKFGKSFNIYELLQPKDFKCLLPHGEVPIIRIYAGGNVDPNGLKNIENARSAGYEGTEVYVQPDARNAKSGFQQFEEAYQFVNAKYPVQRVWLFVSDARAWSLKSVENTYFIRDFVKAAKRRKVVVGIYTSWYDWLLITSDLKDLQMDCVDECPLWYWHTLGQGPNAQTGQDFADFRQFGSWKKAAVKEYDIVDNQLCGRILNWSVFLIPKQTIQMENLLMRTKTNRTSSRKIEAMEAKKLPNFDANSNFIIGNTF